MEAHGADGLVIEGYRACSCGAWVPDHRVPVCDDCRTRLNDASRAGRLRYEVAGRTHEVRPRAKDDRKRRPKRPKVTGDALDARRRADRAKMRAYVRLSHVYATMYALILDEERIREGLEPVSGRQPPRPTTLAAELEHADADLQGRLADAG